MLYDWTEKAEFMSDNIPLFDNSVSKRIPLCLCFINFLFLQGKISWLLAQLQIHWIMEICV